MAVRTRATKHRDAGDGALPSPPSCVAWACLIAHQRACGPYNIDLLAGETIAVEVYGGGWHANGRHAARHGERTRYLLDRGFDVVIVWVEKKYGRAWVGALKHVVADLERSDRTPSAVREYRVIRRRGEILTRNANDRDLPLKPPAEVGRNASGRYERLA
jgi:hypothetical protein